MAASTGRRACHGGVQWRLSDLVGLPLGGGVQAVHAADAVEGVSHLHGELVKRHEQVVHDAVTGGAGPRLSMGVLRGAGGGFVDEGSGSDRLLAFARAVGARVGRGLRQVGQVVVEGARVGGGGSGSSVGVA